MNSSLLFKVSAIIEILIGLAILAIPSFVIGLLLGSELNATGAAVARVLGIGLLSVGIAGWESPALETRLAPRAGLCTYNVGAAIVLMIAGTTGDMNGFLLWPTVALHALIGAIMLRVIFSAPQKAINE
jgi:uncharacterized oligopeptide transporter (OPT) family protein